MTWTNCFASRLAPAFKPCVAVVALGLLVGLAACGGDGRCNGDACSAGEVCRQGRCVPPGSGGCPEGCPPGEVCLRGACVPEGSPPGDAGVGGDGTSERVDRCRRAGQKCNPYAPPTDDFLCVPWQQTVESARCAPICGTPSSSSCPSDSACTPLQTQGGGGSNACRNNDDCESPKTCIQGACLYSACKPSECEGFSVGDSTCTERYSERQQFQNGGRCLGVANGANFCFPAGSKEAGDSCQPLEAAVRSQNFDASCAPGLACVGGTCQKACESGSDCSNELDCVGLESATVREGLGLCADTCEVSASNPCGDGETCLPIGNGEGRCIETGDKSRFDSCQPGEGDCKAGLACVVYQSANPQRGLQQRARCQPICQLSAGEANDNGTISEEAQAKRNATCPQPDPAPASVRVVHLADNLGAIDLYRSNSDQPIATGIEVGGAVGGSSGLYLSLGAGQYTFRALPEGAPSTELPVAEWSASLSAGRGAVFAVVPDRTSGDSKGKARKFDPPGSSSSDPSKVAVRAVHLLDGASDVDVVAAPTGTPPTDDEAVELGTSVANGDATATESVAAGTWDLYLFEAGTSPREPGEALAGVEDVEMDGDRTLFWHGTTDGMDDEPTDQLASLKAGSAPERESEGPRWTCMEARQGNFGYCRQLCTGGVDDYGRGTCGGDKMGCKPVQRPALGRRQHLCTPTGDAAPGEPCNPAARVGACRAGAYCLEYGNTRSNYDGGPERGICHSYCITDSSESDGSNGRLSCNADQACRPISFRDSLGLGRCSFPCEPNDTFKDADCPEGLRSCRPVASLEGPIREGEQPPDIRTRQAFCSASGDVAASERCTGNNCRPEAACMFERSEQTRLTRALLSQYFPSGSAPTCRRRCDPFDGDDASHTCEQSETCLFNSPISAEVGHCAEKVADKSPGAACDRPGLACGEDSICVVQGGSTQCRRFCDYRGTAADGTLQQSTCPGGFVCAPFARDVGLCRPN